MFFRSTDCREAFDLLKKELTTASVLSYSQFNTVHPFILETDASGKGLGAILAQQQEDGKVLWGTIWVKINAKCDI